MELSGTQDAINQEVTQPVQPLSCKEASKQFRTAQLAENPCNSFTEV